MVNILIFANCHGAIYKEHMENAGFQEWANIEHVLSYENLNNFNDLESKFRSCDVLVIQPVENYDQFKIGNIKTLLKNGCLLVVVPFVRFEGYWFSNDVRALKKFASAAVMFFPAVNDVAGVEDYLTGSSVSADTVLNNFETGLVKLRGLETSGDVMFSQFFEDNHRFTPLFRDSYHPTAPFYENLANQIVNIVSDRFGVVCPVAGKTVGLLKKEFGHFKPITDFVGQILNLNYGLDSYYIFSREEYMRGVLLYENSESGFIADLASFRKYLLQEKGAI